MEKALVKVGSIKAGSFWLTKKAKEEFNNISEDLTRKQTTNAGKSAGLNELFLGNGIDLSPSES